MTFLAERITMLQQEINELKNQYLKETKQKEADINRMKSRCSRGGDLVRKLTSDLYHVKQRYQGRDTDYCSPPKNTVILVLYTSTNVLKLINSDDLKPGESKLWWYLPKSLEDKIKGNANIHNYQTAEKLDDAIDTLKEIISIARSTINE